MSLKYVQEHLDAAGPADVTAAFADWQALVERLKDKVAARFELQRDPSTEPLEAFDDGGTGSGARGRVRGYTGPEIDWMVHSYMENASLGLLQRAPDHLARPAGARSRTSDWPSAASRRAGSTSTPCPAPTWSPTPSPSTATTSRSTRGGSRCATTTTGSSRS